jgi:inhibitor of cysteine peptidase
MMAATRAMSLLVLVAFISGCAKSASSTTSTTAEASSQLVTPTLTEKDNGQTVALLVGQGTQVQLPANPSTGYSWSQVAGDAKVIEPVGAAAFSPQREAPGAGGTSTLTYRAVGAGETVLKLIYHRPWERDVPPVKTFETRVVVK